MAKHASNGTASLRLLACVVVVMAGTGACKKWKARAPMLPPTASAEKGEDQPKVAATGYRTQGGTPIAPVVIEDDPAPPPQLQPSSGGASAGNLTLNGDPKGLTREALNIAIQSAMGSIAGCFSSLTQDPMVAVSFEADPSGRPSLVRVSGAPPDAEHCIRNIVQGVRFPAFEGKGVQVDLPLSFHRVAQSPPPGNSAGQQQPAQAPLFLQP
jgi:hypothetical protein